MGRYKAFYLTGTSQVLLNCFCAAKLKKLSNLHESKKHHSTSLSYDGSVHNINGLQNKYQGTPGIHVNLFLCRCSWGLWWRNRKATDSRSTTHIWFTMRQGRGNAPRGQHTRIPGGSKAGHPQEGGVIMGHRHRQVRVHCQLQHRQVSSALLWPPAGYLPLWHVGMKMGTFLMLRTCRYGVFTLLYIVLSWVFVEVFVEMQQKMNRDRKREEGLVSNFMAWFLFLIQEWNTTV